MTGSIINGTKGGKTWVWNELWPKLIHQHPAINKGLLKEGSWFLILGSFVPKNSSNRAKNYYSFYWFFWDLRLTSFDIPKDAVVPKILVLSNIFGFPAVNWTPKWTKTLNFVCVPFEQKFKLLTDFSNTVLALSEESLWSKLTTDVYLNTVFHLIKYPRVKWA